MNFPLEKNFESLDELDIIAKEFCLVLRNSDVVALNGDLGTGKTAFVKLICNHFSISDANSPTFAIVNEYHGKHLVFHFDFYRVKKIEELYDLGFEEYLNNESSITFIEWAYQFEEILPSKYYAVQLFLNDDNTRTIRISKK